MERSQFNIFWLLDSNEKREICVDLRRFLLCWFRLSYWLEQFPDILYLKTKFSLLQNRHSSQLGPEDLPDDLLGGHILGHGGEEGAEGGELVHLLLPHLGQVHRLLERESPRYERDKDKSKHERGEGHLLDWGVWGKIGGRQVRRSERDVGEIYAVAEWEAGWLDVTFWEGEKEMEPLDVE